MVSSVLKEITNYIDNKQHFLLSGGAGSGKTYSLIEIVNYIFENNKNPRVACITYTNIATNEIKERSDHKDLCVSTIHDFLWSNIKLYQKNLKQALVSLIEKKEIGYTGEIELNLEYFNSKNEQGKERKINYKEYKKLEDGIISHNEILKVSKRMFETYPLLSDILKDKFDFILVDEYQDTLKEVSDILLEILPDNTNKSNVLGFFGDKMQNIYNTGIGGIDKYLSNDLVKEVKKSDNYRCSKAVIGLINKLRTDSIKQKPARKDESGNIKNKEGDIKFIYSDDSNITIDEIKQNAIFNEWNWDDFKTTKELYLTHRLISKKTGFERLYEVYKDRNEKLLKPESHDTLIKYIFKIQTLIYLYNNKKYNEFIKKTDFKIKSNGDKKKLKEFMDAIDINQSISEMIMYFRNSKFKLLKEDLELNEKTEGRYEKLKSLPYAEVINAYDYVNDFTPFSTQHGIKGTEFDNVFVILDNGNWNQYNFKYLFSNNTSNGSFERTSKLFYVCCSRAKDNLVVYFNSPNIDILKKAKVWFGEENIIKL